MPESPGSHELGRQVPREGESMYPGSRARADYKIDHDTGCWVWQKSLINGYPNQKQHRRYWEMANGRKLARGEHVHHKCRNRACVNPKHLEAVDAIAHAIEHRLGERGQTIQDIIDLREAGKDPNVSLKAMAEKYGITPNNVWYIWTGRSWSHLGPPVRPEGVVCKNCGKLITSGPRHKQFCDRRCRGNFNQRKPEQRARKRERDRAARAAGKQ